MNNVDSMLLGANGTETTSGAGTLTGNYFAIQTLQETAFGNVEEQGSSETADGLATLTVPAGLTIFGNFTVVPITSGAIRCYKK